jgi:hypothetical protein
MWRILLVTSVLLVSCAGGIGKQTSASQGSLDSELNTVPSSTPNPRLSSQSEPEIEAMSAFPNLGSAPELTNEVWLNPDRPVHLVDLRGQVVLIDMWTFG